MLDLNKLEKQLDEALANETPETLMAWLVEQRKKTRPFSSRNIDDSTIDDYFDGCEIHLINT